MSGPFNVGDYVYLKRWDDSESPKNRLGVCRVETIERTPFCESGMMVTVVSRYGEKRRLDANWMAPYEV